jgi:LysM repeat protein
MKMPKLPSLFKSRPPKRLNAATAARHAADVDEYGEEPQTRFSVALCVVAMLHIVAVGGIYAFNTIKTNRKVAEQGLQSGSPKSAPSSGAAPVAASSTGTQGTRPVAVGGGAPKVEPASLKPVASAPTVAALAPQSGSVGVGKVHQVKSGETVAKLAAMYGVTVEEIESANGSKAVAILKPGQSVQIPRKGVVKKGEEAPKVAATAKPVGSTYVVAKGDNPVTIAKKFGVRSEELLKLNGIEDPKKLKIGQTLQVPEKKK